jgi:hypothetical protein
MAICGCSSAKVPKCAVGSFPVRVFAANFLASFITRVADAPLQIEGRLAPDGIWRITSYLIPAGAERPPKPPSPI